MQRENNDVTNPIQNRAQVGIVPHWTRLVETFFLRGFKSCSRLFKAADDDEGKYSTVIETPSDRCDPEGQCMEDYHSKM